MICTRCGAPYLAADPECPRCGLPLTPSIAAAPTGSPFQKAPATAQSSAEPNRPLVVIGAVAIVCVIGVVLALNRPGSGDDGSQTDARTPSGAIVETPTPVSPSDEPLSSEPAGENLAAAATISAIRTARSKKDDAGRTVSYGTDHLADGDLSTAWRAPSFYDGQSITITLPKESSIEEVGLTNGYTKRDETSNVDRYEAERQIRTVTWIFDDGTSIMQNLELGVRSIQRIKINPIQTKTVKLRIDQTKPPGSATDDYTAITEIFLGSSAE